MFLVLSLFSPSEGDGGVVLVRAVEVAVGLPAPAAVNQRGRGKGPYIYSALPACTRWNASRGHILSARLSPAFWEKRDFFFLNIF